MPNAMNNWTILVVAQDTCDLSSCL